MTVRLKLFSEHWAAGHSQVGFFADEKVRRARVRKHIRAREALPELQPDRDEMQVLPADRAPSQIPAKRHKASEHPVNFQETSRF